jgi:hypothetical protein
MKYLLFTLIIGALHGTATAADLFQCDAEDGQGASLEVSWRGGMFSYEDNMISLDWNPQGLSLTPTNHSRHIFDDSGLESTPYEQDGQYWEKITVVLDAAQKLEFDFHNTATGDLAWGELRYDMESFKMRCHKQP